MKVLDLRCDLGHPFEGWFASEQDYLDQEARHLLACPTCGSQQVVRLPSAPRLNLSGAAGPAAAAAEAAAEAAVPAAMATRRVSAVQAPWIQAVRAVLQNTEDVGERFAEEARRMHYGESESRGIRGQASEDERSELLDEGIEVFSLPVPPSLKGPQH
jgi:hypothetical protein